MKPIGILYASREGQTERIVRRLAHALEDRGFIVDQQNLDISYSPVRPADYAALILASSVHIGKHDMAVVRAVKEHLHALQHMPAAFVSVSLSQAGVELPGATPEQRTRSAAGVQEVLTKFYAETGWHPTDVLPVAGALRYSKYNFLIRLLMKRIARKSGGSTDTSREYEYTNWEALDRFAANFANQVVEVESGGLHSVP